MEKLLHWRVDSVPLPWGTIGTPSMIPSVEVPRKIHTRKGKKNDELQWRRAGRHGA